LHKNHFIFADKFNSDHIDEYELESIIKQKPNKKIFWVAKLYLWIYNLPNPEKVEQKKTEKQIKVNLKNQKKKNKHDRKNQKRITKGKKTKPFKAIKYKPFLRQLFLEVTGEPPVIFDSTLMTKSSKQLSTFLVKKGYFNNLVRDSVVHTKKKKVHVHYIIKKKAPYITDTIHYDIPDSNLNELLLDAQPDRIIKPGQIFDIDKLDDERDRLTEYLKDRGYYAFTKDFIFFDVDSAFNDHTVQITMHVQNIIKKHPYEIDSIVEEKHMKFVMNKILIYTDYDVKLGEDPENYKSITIDNYEILYKDKLNYNPRTILSSIFMRKAHLYRLKEEESTRKKLAGLGVFRSIQMKFDPDISNTSSPSLDCKIKLFPKNNQSFSLESDGTNKGGNLGISGTFHYSHQNIFKGAEKFNFNFTGGLEAQQTFADNRIENEGIVSSINSFNTVEFGPELSLQIPKFVFLGIDRFKKTANPTTILKATLNFQKRPDFQRGVQDFSFSYKWKENKEISHHITPLEISAVEVDLSDDFSNRITRLNDQFLAASFQDHIISSTSYGFTYNQQQLTGRRHTYYYHSTIETAGNLLRLASSLLERPINQDNSYEILNIQFAQYVKMGHDFRYYFTMNDKNSIATRIIGEIGIPLSNLKNALPFEKSFFAGGTNSIRAWRARTLGPGSYLDSDSTNLYFQRFDRIGDIHLEGNFEYRFDLLKSLEGALFLDAGNIWLTNENPTWAGSGFSPDFWKEIAIGGGFGVRFDLSFFIIRLDLALPLRDPSLSIGERWIFEPKENINNLRKVAAELDPDIIYKPYNNIINFNLGIGYPF